MGKLMTLADAAKLLDLGASTLRNQVRNGALRATLFGKTYIVDEEEVERYRREHLGKAGRPVGTKDGKPRRSA